MATNDANPLLEMPIFKGLSEWKLKRLLADATNRVYGASDVIVEEGDPGDEFYVVVSGKLVVTKGLTEQFMGKVGKGRTVLATLNPGDVFGEMAILEQKPRVARITAEVESRVLSFSNDQFIQLMLDYPAFFLKVIRLMGHRIRENAALEVNEYKEQLREYSEINRKQAEEIVELKKQVYAKEQMVIRYQKEMALLTGKKTKPAAAPEPPKEQ